MAVLQDQNQSSSLPPPSTAANNRGKLPKNGEKLLRKKSSGLTQSQTAKTIVLHANPMKPESNKRKRDSVESLFDASEAQAAVLATAKEVKANLNPQFPTFLKEMLRSHVTKGFWLGLPRTFCSEHMPREDTDIVLEDESGKEYVTKYLAEKMGLSGGWRKFSIEHKIEEGDVVIYQLVTCSRFKVYIVRLNDSDDMGSVLGLMRLNVCTNPMYTEEIVPSEREGSECLELTPEENAITDGIKSGPRSDQPESESKDLGLDFLDELTLSETDVTFEEVKCIEDFKVLVNGVIINSALKHILAKYYDLCRSQNSFLHEHLLDGLNCKLVAGAISEIVNIADAIRAYKITTSKDNFLKWETILKAFGDLGMNVGFLRTRLDQLRSLATKCRRFEEARLERLQAEEELKRLEGKVLEVKQCINRLDSEIGTLGTDSEDFDDMFKKVAKAPW